MDVICDVDAPRLSVWNALVDAKVLPRWCCDLAETKLAPGGPFRLHGPHHPAARLSPEGHTGGEVRGFEPGATFQWDWHMHAGRSEVTYILEDHVERDATRLLVRHRAPPLPAGLALSDIWYVTLWGLKDWLEKKREPLRLDWSQPVLGRAVRWVEIAEPPAAVFAVLTDPDKIAHWLSGTRGTLELREGGDFDTGMRDAAGARVGPGRVLALQPDRELRVSWSYTGDPGESELAFKLDDLGGDRTRLAILHEGFPPDHDAVAYGCSWQACLLSIRAIAEGRELAVRPAQG